MSAHTPAGPGISRRALRIAAALLAAGLLTALMAAGASAKPVISQFAVGTSDSQAGGHPDLNMRLLVDKPAEPEVIRDLDFNMPEGVFGNPGAIFKCLSQDFVVNHCGPGTQVGLVTIYANYKGNPGTVLGTVPVYNMFTIDEEETARMAFTVPTLNIPVSIPISVRSESDYSLNLRVQTISQSVALAGTAFTVWGFPADPEHDTERFHPGDPGEPPGCPGEENALCNSAPYPQAGIIERPFINNPSVCTGEEIPVTAEVTTYQDPENPAFIESTYPETEGCEEQRFDPVFNLGLTTGEADAPSGLDIQLVADQFLGANRRPRPTCAANAGPAARGSRSTPTRPTARPPAPTRRRTSAPTGPPPAPTTQRSGPSRSSPRPSTAPLDGLALHRRAEAGQPVPPLHDLRRLRDPREAGRQRPSRPADRSADGRR